MKPIYLIAMICILLAGCTPAKYEIQGAPGPTGAQGPQGETGATGPQGTNGHSLVSETVSASGCECDSSGGQRLDIYVDMDDSGDVSEGDTWTSSLIACNGHNGLNGADGLPGAQGAQGIPGEPGPQGETGATGATGAQGIAGPAGSMGPQGAPGPQGIAGPAGPAGPQGPQGATGAQGPTGSGANLQRYTLSSTCQSIGDGYYATRDSDQADIHTPKTTYSCPSGYALSGTRCTKSHSPTIPATSTTDNCGTDVVTVYAEHTANGSASYWLTSTRLAFNDNSGNLVVLNFN